MATRYSRLTASKRCRTNSMMPSRSHLTTTSSLLNHRWPKTRPCSNHHPFCPCAAGAKQQVANKRSDRKSDRSSPRFLPLHPPPLVWSPVVQNKWHQTKGGWFDRCCLGAGPQGWILLLYPNHCDDTLFPIVTPSQKWGVVGRRARQCRMLAERSGRAPPGRHDLLWTRNGSGTWLKVREMRLESEVGR